MEDRRITVHDLMQAGYSYVLTEPVGKNFHAQFSPDLTPKEMLELGVFGGKYMTDCGEEFPAAWYENAKLCSTRHDPAWHLRWDAEDLHSPRTQGLRVSLHPGVVSVVLRQGTLA